MIFRGREIVHSEIGREILNRLAVELGDTVIVESSPRQEGNTMVQILSPKKEVVPAKPKPKPKATPARRSRRPKPKTPAAEVAAQAAEKTE